MDCCGRLLLDPAAPADRRDRLASIAAASPGASGANWLSASHPALSRSIAWAAWSPVPGSRSREPGREPDRLMPARLETWIRLSS